MLSKRGKLAILTLALGVSVLAALTVPAALGMYSAESNSPGNTFTSAPVLQPIPATSVPPPRRRTAAAMATDLN